jgi:hypothetical protein
MRIMAKCASVLMVLACAGLGLQASATTFSIGGASIMQFGDPSVDPTYIPTGTADFSVDQVNDVLTLTLTSTSPEELARWSVLQGLTFDIAEDNITLTPISAFGDHLVDPFVEGGEPIAVGFPMDNVDISDQWAFKDNILAGALGTYGVGSAGDILGGLDSFGDKDCFTDCTGNAPNGSDYGIVGPDFNAALDGLDNAGPHVQSTVTFLFGIGGTNAASLDMGDFENVNALYGTVGATVVPEPSGALLCGLGFATAGWRVRRGRRN